MKPGWKIRRSQFVSTVRYRTATASWKSYEDLYSKTMKTRRRCLGFPILGLDSSLFTLLLESYFWYRLPPPTLFSHTSSTVDQAVLHTAGRCTTVIPQVLHRLGSWFICRHSSTSNQQQVVQQRPAVMAAGQSP